MSTKLVIKKDKIIDGDFSCTLEDLISEEFFSEIEPLIEKYKNDSFEVNEIYLYFLQKYLAIEKYVKDRKVDRIELENADKVLSAYVIDIAKRNSISINDHYSSFGGIVTKSKTIILLLLSILYLVVKLLRISCKNIFPQTKEFAIIRDKASDGKFKDISIDKFYDDILWEPKTNSIYKFFPFTKKLSWFLKSLILSFREIRKIGCLAQDYMGKCSQLVVLEHYAKRTASTCLYYCLIETLFKEHKPDVYYTGLNLERYAIVEDVLARKYGVKTICIPHGLEYGFKFPYGFTTDRFYTTSNYASDYLNKMYTTQKFVFDNEIANKMFKRSYILPENHKKKLIFFTESRDVHVNQKIVEQMLSYLKGTDYKLYLKLHPADKKDNYSSYNIEFIENFDESICDNICIARKSTVLLEATYNGSLSAAILINNKDKAMFYTFPSLQSERIMIFTSVKELVYWINKQK